jgi:hypothetical protein
LETCQTSQNCISRKTVIAIGSSWCLREVSAPGEFVGQSFEPFFKFSDFSKKQSAIPQLRSPLLGIDKAADRIVQGLHSIRSIAATTPSKTWEPAMADLPMVCLVIEDDTDVPHELQFSYWQNCRFKLRLPRVQAWIRWAPATDLHRLPRVDELPLELRLVWDSSPRSGLLPLDGGMRSTTSYGLAKSVALLASERPECSVKAFMCKTEATHRSRRVVTSIDLNRPVVLLSPAHASAERPEHADLVEGDEVMMQMLRAVAGQRAFRRPRGDESDAEGEDADGDANDGA